MAEAFRQSLHVKEVETVSVTPVSAIHNLTVPVRRVIKVHEHLYIHPTYPFHIKNGVESILVVSSMEKVRHLLTDLKEQIPGVSFQAISRKRVDGTKRVLTERQREAF